MLVPWCLLPGLLAAPISPHLFFGVHLEDSWPPRVEVCMLWSTVFVSLELVLTRAVGMNVFKFR